MDTTGVLIGDLYQAVVDDEAFTALPNLLARHFGARAAIIHWLDHSNRSQVAAHSGYHRPEHMALFAENFAAHDIWRIAAARPENRNIAWQLSELVGEREYERSVFYNDLIRPIGDDTWYCAGAAMETPGGFGMIGLHRGRSEPDFDATTIEQLKQTTKHLRRTLILRAELSAQAGALRSWEQVFQDGFAPTLMVDAQGRLRRSNSAATDLLSHGRVIRQSGRQVMPRLTRQVAAWHGLLLRATDPANPEAGQGVFGEPSHSLWLARFLPVVSGGLAGCALVTISDRSRQCATIDVTNGLRHMYQITAAEAAVAVALADGASLAEIASMRRTTNETIRYQVKQIMAKTGTQRQSEIVRLVLQITQD